MKLSNDHYNTTAFTLNTYRISTCQYGDSNCTQGRPGAFVLGMAHFF